MPREDHLYIDTDVIDLAPWIHTPTSSRVSRLRYDHGNRAVQVQWTNQKNVGYVYGDCTYEEYRRFARAASRGQYINRELNALPYRLMSADEVNAVGNENRKGITSRVEP